MSAVLVSWWRESFDHACLLRCQPEHTQPTEKEIIAINSEKIKYHGNLSHAVTVPSAESALRCIKRKSEAGNLCVKLLYAGDIKSASLDSFLGKLRGMSSITLAGVTR
jgi:hypothetical protein